MRSLAQEAQSREISAIGMIELASNKVMSLPG